MTDLPALAPNSDRVVMEVVCDRLDPEGAETPIINDLATSGPAFLAQARTFIESLGFDPDLAVVRTTIHNSESETASTGFIPLAAEQ